MSRDQPVDEGRLARAAFVRSWARSLLQYGRDESDEELLESAMGLLEHLERMEAGEKELEAMEERGRRKQAELRAAAAKGRR